MHRWLVEHGWVNDSNGSAAGRALSYVAFLSVGFLPLALYLFILTVVVTWGDLLEAYANGYLFSFLWAMPSFKLGVIFLAIGLGLIAAVALEWLVERWRKAG